MTDTPSIATRELLAISGSLRAGATNTALLDAAALLAPPDVRVVRFGGLAALPAFNPDLDTIGGDALPPIVRELRARIGRAAGVLVSSPEYAHGIAGSFKNLLDWLVGSVEFHGKPIAILGASTRSLHAPAQLREVLTTMNVGLVDAACVAFDVPRGLDAEALARHPEIGPAVRAAVTALVDAGAR